MEEIKEEKQEQKLVGQLRPHRGHTTYKYNTITGKLSEAVFELESENKRITVEEGCIYVSALNIKNAVKKLGKYHGVNVKIK